MQTTYSAFEAYRQHIAVSRTKRYSHLYSSCDTSVYEREERAQFDGDIFIAGSDPETQLDCDILLQAQILSLDPQCSAFLTGCITNVRNLTVTFLLQAQIQA